MPEQVTSLTAEDLAIIHESILPSARKRFLYISLLFILALPFAPYMRVPYGEAMMINYGYGKSLLVFGLLYSFILIYLYFSEIQRVKKEIRANVKHRHFTCVSKKSWLSTLKFSISFTALPKKLDKKFVYPAADSANWQEGDEVRIDYLPLSGEIIRIEKLDR